MQDDILIIVIALATNAVVSYTGYTLGKATGRLSAFTEMYAFQLECKRKPNESNEVWRHRLNEMQKENSSKLSWQLFNIEHLDKLAMSEGFELGELDEPELEDDDDD